MKQCTMPRHLRQALRQGDFERFKLSASKGGKKTAKKRREHAEMIQVMEAHIAEQRLTEALELLEQTGEILIPVSTYD